MNMHWLETLGWPFISTFSLPLTEELPYYMMPPLTIDLVLMSQPETNQLTTNHRVWHNGSFFPWRILFLNKFILGCWMHCRWKAFLTHQWVFMDHLKLQNCEAGRGPEDGLTLYFMHGVAEGLKRVDTCPRSLSKFYKQHNFKADQQLRPIKESVQDQERKRLINIIAQLPVYSIY